MWFFGPALAEYGFGSARGMCGMCGICAQGDIAWLPPKLQSVWGDKGNRASTLPNVQLQTWFAMFDGCMKRNGSVGDTAIGFRKQMAIWLHTCHVESQWPCRPIHSAKLLISWCNLLNVWGDTAIGLQHCGTYGARRPLVSNLGMYGATVSLETPAQS